MPKLAFTHKELAEILVREFGVKEGIWGLQIRFAMQASNVGSGPGDLMPAAILAITEIGLQQFDEINNLSVDAAELAKTKDAKPG